MKSMPIKPQNVEKIPCEPPACFVGSYAPVAKAGETGPFFVTPTFSNLTVKWKLLGQSPSGAKISSVGSKLKIKVE